MQLWNIVLYYKLSNARARTNILSERVLQMEKGIDSESFKYWGELWFRKQQLNFSRSYSLTAKNHLKNINRFIGTQPIGHIKPIDIDNIIIEYAQKNPHTKRPTAKQTLKDMRNIAASVFDYAMENEIIEKNPARGRQIPKRAPQTHRRALTRKEQIWIIKMPHRMRLGALIMMFAGLRRGELIPLTWNDIDFDNLTISVNKSVEKIGNNFVEKPGTKNSKTRIVNITLDLAIELLNAKKTAISKYVCCKIDGSMHTESSWKRAWQSFQCDLNATFGDFQDNSRSKYNPHGVPKMIEKITPHMLRHTYATLLYASGVDVLTASKLLGHADIKTTLDIYTHLQEETMIRSVDKLDTYVSKLFK